jgi:hypothetical protein
MNTSGNKTKTTTKKKTTGSRIQTGKKQNTKPSSKVCFNIKLYKNILLLFKTGIKSTQGSIIKKKKPIIKSPKSYPMDTNDAPLSLSIEERVKLRRTKPFLTPTKPVLNKKPQVNTNHPIKKAVKRIHSSKPKKQMVTSKKFFLGSGLDLDNIVLGNRQRRSLHT